MPHLKPSVQIFAPSNWSSINVLQAESEIQIFLNPPAPLLTLTINFPNGTYHGQKMLIQNQQMITGVNFVWSFVNALSSMLTVAKVDYI